MFLRANNQIRFSPVVVIDDEGVNLGQIPTFDALKLANEKGLDLVEINPTSKPPICKIMDFGKYKYDLAKKDKESKSRQHSFELKEIRLTFRIGDHDIEYKAKQARSFFDGGNPVKVTMRLRGRENSLVEVAMDVFKKFALKTDLGYENPPRKVGNQIVTMLAPKKIVK